MKELKIFSGKSNAALAEKVCQLIRIPLGSLQCEEYKQGCFEIIFKEDVCQKTVFLIQTSLSDVNNLHRHIWELFQMINSAKNCKAEEIIVVMPYVSYARSDKIYAQGMGINGELLVRLLESSGMTGFIGIDFHSDKFESFFSSKVYHLSALDLLVKELKKENLENALILPADMGAFKKGSILAEKLGVPVGRVEKERISNTEVKIKSISGEFANKDVVIFDDEISTGTTLKTLAGEVERSGAKSIIFAVTHGLFVGNAVENFKEIKNLKRIIVTDTVPVTKDVQEALSLNILSVDGLLAEKIKEICEN